MSKAPFHPVKAPFGNGNNEQATQDAFVEYVGGWNKAEQLSKLFNDSYATPWPPGHRYYKTKYEVFRKKAKNAGFDDNEVSAFLML